MSCEHETNRYLVRRWTLFDEFQPKNAYRSDDRGVDDGFKRFSGKSTEEIGSGTRVEREIRIYPRNDGIETDGEKNVDVNAEKKLIKNARLECDDVDDE